MADPQENLHVGLALALGRPPTASNKTLLADVEQLMREHRGVVPNRGPQPATEALFDLESAS